MLIRNCLLVVYTLALLLCARVCVSVVCLCECVCEIAAAAFVVFVSVLPLDGK